jgi:preprotein translocase subunit SecE
MSWSVYRPGEGRLARFSSLMMLLAFGAFSAYRWYLWALDKGYEWPLPRIGAHQMNWGEVVAAILVIVTTLISYRICFVRPGTSDFLVETEIELRKVTWPEWKPLFRSGTELWGSTYVVIVVVVALTMFIFLVDVGLQVGAQQIWFR